MNWSEELPDKCPPAEAVEADGFVVYRLAVKNEFDEEDFKSQRALKPHPHVFKGVDECIARSVSVFNEMQKCVDMIKLPLYKGKFKTVLELKLTGNDGQIMKTFTDPNHYSWWRSSSFDISNAIIKNQ